ncbi:mRNA triphosphatase CET1 [Rhizodiscina lignyota]|uniref:mRNA-capping enzyme subunit beta n=1 Tax=Rhizodiscina lignyota TaxID=1504668 RepID=A0A9P4IRX3_9PEZI|nr:mRNA triphosphatase CET1 [Rhizodiscina lignyota]
MDLRNILNTDGSANKAPAPTGRSMSISADQFAHPPPRMQPVRAYSSIGDLSPESQRSILQSHPPPLLRTSPEIQRDIMQSQTPTTAHSSPDFQRDILNPQAPPSAGLSSPSDRAIRKSSTPAPPPAPEFNSRPSMAAPPADRDAQSTDSRTSQKRKADAAFDGETQIRPERPSVSTNASSDMQNHGAVEKMSATPDGTPTPTIKREPGSAPSVTEQPARKKRKYLEVPKWAQRQPVGSRRFHGPSKSLVNGHSQRPSSREATPARGPERSEQPNPPQSQVQQPHVQQPHVQQPHVQQPHVQQPHGMQAHGMPEPNIAAISAFYETRRAVMTFLQQYVVAGGDPSIAQTPTGAPPPAIAHWEIEAKLGKIINKMTGERLDLGIQTEAVLRPNVHDVRFESGVTPQQYQRLNQYLNEATRLSMGKGRVPITYKHPRETDAFYELNQTGYLQLPQMARQVINPNHKRKMRITTDSKTNQITAKIVKARVADIDILRPDNDLDLRISVNLEIEFPGEINDYINLTMSPRSQRDNSAREKDRLSYTHQATQIDLTKVTTTDVDGPPTVQHEVEVEVDGHTIVAEGQKCVLQQPNLYEEVVGQFVENAIVLVRAADDIHQPRYCL